MSDRSGLSFGGRRRSDRHLRRRRRRGDDDAAPRRKMTPDSERESHGFLASKMDRGLPLGQRCGEGLGRKRRRKFLGKTRMRRLSSMKN